jgi:hypothetical protein
VISGPQRLFGQIPGEHGCGSRHQFQWNCSTRSDRKSGPGVGVIVGVSVMVGVGVTVGVEVIVGVGVVDGVDVVVGVRVGDPVRVGVRGVRVDVGVVPAVTAVGVVWPRGETARGLGRTGPSTTSRRKLEVSAPPES